MAAVAHIVNSLFLRITNLQILLLTYLLLLLQVCQTVITKPALIKTVKLHVPSSAVLEIECKRKPGDGPLPEKK